MARYVSFSEIVFYLREDSKDDTASLVGVQTKLRDGSSRIYVVPKCAVNQNDLRAEHCSITSAQQSRLCGLAVFAAAVRLLMQKISDVDSINLALEHLQNECGVQSFYQGIKVGGPIAGVLGSKLEEHPLSPFCVSRPRRGTKIHLIADAFSEMSHNIFTFAEAGELIDLDGEPRLISDSRLVELLQFGAVRRQPFATDLRKFQEWAIAQGLSKSETVPLEELGPILRSYSELISLKASTVAERLNCDRPENQWPFRQYDDRQQLLQHLVENLYPGHNKERIGLEHLKSLLSAHDDPSDSKDLPELMAEWLTGEVVDGHWLKQDFASFEASSESLHGLGCKYQNAKKRMPGLEAAFVRVELVGNTKQKAPDENSFVPTLSELLRNFERGARTVPHSNSHVHPGDELVIVLKGSIFVHLENTGVWTIVQEGDYVHYNAEIPHSVWNTASEPAEILVIRFFQLTRHGTRRMQNETLSQIEKLMGQLTSLYSHRNSPSENLLGRLRHDFNRLIDDSAKSFQLWTRIAPWVHDRTQPPKAPLRFVGPDTAVADLVGLSKFLHSYISTDSYLTSNYSDSTDLGNVKLRALKLAILDMYATNTVHTNSVLSIAAISGYKAALDEFIIASFNETDVPFVRSCFEGVPKDGSTIPARVLTEIARKLAIPSVLLDGYLASPALRIVTVRGAGERKSRLSDWVDPQHSSHTDGANGASYFLPSRILANSDMLITLLHLSPGGHTAWNHHPGFEAIIVNEGRVKVEFQDDESCTEECCYGEMLIYKSGISHRVIALGQKVVAIVLRFNVP